MFERFIAAYHLTPAGQQPLQVLDVELVVLGHQDP